MRGAAVLPGMPATEPPDGEQGREERDAYYTPDALALAICRSLRTELHRSPAEILEPGCGGGAFLRGAAQVWPKAKLTGIDLMPACEGPGRIVKGDIFRFFDGWPLIVGNPPYGCAERFVRHCMPMLSRGGFLAFLLRLSFLESAARVPLYRDHPLFAFQPIAQRASFTGGAVDQVGYGLYIWRQGHRGEGRIFPPLEWR